MAAPDNNVTALLVNVILEAPVKPVPFIVSNDPFVPKDDAVTEEMANGGVAVVTVIGVGETTVVKPSAVGVTVGIGAVQAVIAEAESWFNVPTMLLVFVRSESASPFLDAVILATLCAPPFVSESS